MRQAFNAALPSHEDTLELLWLHTFGTESTFVRVSPKWQDLGFQQQDPGPDFRSAGFLSLKCLNYFAREYPESWKAMYTWYTDKPSSDTFPPAVAGINLCWKLITELRVNSDDLQTMTQTYWEVFAHPDGFFEVFSLAFKLFYALWQAQSARQDEFNGVRDMTARRILQLMHRGPSTIEHLQSLAAGSTDIPDSVVSSK